MGQQDGQTHRVAKQVNGTTTQAFLYKDSLRIIAELDAAGEIVSRFNYVGGSHSPDTMTTGGQTYRFVKDQVGSPRLVVNVADGSVAQRIDYDAFGVVTLDTNPGFQPFGFAGGLYDADTGLVRFGARDYDAQSGRWTAKDPIRWEGDQENFYVYVNGDPVNWIDISGNQAIGITLPTWITTWLGGGTGAGAGAGVGAGLAVGGAAAAAGICLALAADQALKLIDELNVPITTSPDVDDTSDEADCTQQWRAAREKCGRLLTQKQTPQNRRMVGPIRTIADCARGFVTAACGGNPYR